MQGTRRVFGAYHEANGGIIQMCLELCAVHFEYFNYDTSPYMCNAFYISNILIMTLRCTRVRHCLLSTLKLAHSDEYVCSDTHETFAYTVTHLSLSLNLT